MSTLRSAVHVPADPRLATLASEVAEHLGRTPRQLPTHALYDGLGSTLFEAICCLPWYGVARTEQALLETPPAEIHTLVGEARVVVELGPGSGEKLKTLLAARLVPKVRVELVDVSAEALAQASRTLATMQDLDVWTYQHTYQDSLARLARSPHGGPTLVAFLGSNIGNFDAAGADALLRAIRTAVRVGSHLLLGVDLVKPEAELVLAYDDPLGVTAAFNRNLLVRLNRELGANFALGGFGHRAVWNAEASRVEMHLVSTERQQVQIPMAGVDLTFEPGETIWTESSYKYRPDEVEHLLQRAGFAMAGQWTRDGFALTLARARA